MDYQQRKLAIEISFAKNENTSVNCENDQKGGPWLRYWKCHQVKAAGDESDSVAEPVPALKATVF